MESSFGHPIHPSNEGVCLEAPHEPSKNSASQVVTVTGSNSSNEHTSSPESKATVGQQIRFMILFVGLALTTFAIGLDNTVIATAIPHITSDFNSFDDVGWYGSAFLLALTAIQPTFGKFYGLFSVKWTYLAALLLFEFASILCAVTINSDMLIVGRALAGAGAGGLFTGGMTIIGYKVGMRKRAMYIGMLSSLFGISSIVGPVLGGALTDRATWRWCFWINLPFGALALISVFCFFEDPMREKMSAADKLKELDVIGTILLIGAVTSLLLALQWGGISLLWSDSHVWGCLLCFGLVVLMFCWWQFKLGERATIPLNVVSQRSVLSSAMFIFFAGMGMYTHIYYLPFYFQVVQAVDAEDSGIRTIPYLLSNALASVIIGGLVAAVGVYTPYVWFGAAVFTVGAGMLTTLTVKSSAAMWIGFQLLAGIGIGSCVQIPYTAVQVVLSEKQMPTGVSLVIFSQQLGGALAISIAQNVFRSEIARQLAVYAPTVNVLAVINAGASDIPQAVMPQELAGTRQAYAIALARALLLPVAAGGVAFLCSLGLEWKSLKQKKVSGELGIETN